MTIFPLPLTPFEYLFWCDDTPEYPTTFPIELRFTGLLQREAFGRALTSTLERHPMLAALVEMRGGWPWWIACPERAPHLDWSDDARPLEHVHGTRIDLALEPGLRVWVRRLEGHTHVYLQIHHACCDGLAVQSVIEDLLLFYCQNIGILRGEFRPRPLDARLLRHRRGRGISASRRLSHFPQVVSKAGSALWTWGQLLRRNPAVIASASARSDVQVAIPGNDLSDVFGFSTYRFDVQQIRRLKQVATLNNVTTNDLLLRDLFRALDKWNCEQGDPSDGWLRINMPANERKLADRAMPAANRLSFTFLTRRRGECRHRDQLLRSIREETESIKRMRAGACFLQGLAAASQVRGVIPWILRGRRSFATICLSNVGRVLARTSLPRRQKRIVCGDAVLDRVSGTPFIRPMTRAAITVIAYANEMTLNLRCDQRHFTHTQRQSFLCQYATMIEQTLECGR